MIKLLTKPAVTALGWAVALPAFAATINTSLPSGLTSDLGTRNPEQIVIGLVNWALGLLALIAVVLVLIGGFRWMTASGNEEKIESAKKLLVAALIGLVIILAAWGISTYAIGILLQQTKTG